jgi:hypothetical protein
MFRKRILSKLIELKFESKNKMRFHAKKKNQKN